MSDCDHRRNTSAFHRCKLPPSLSLPLLQHAIGNQHGVCFDLAIGNTHTNEDANANWHRNGIAHRVHFSVGSPYRNKYEYVDNDPDRYQYADNYSLHLSVGFGDAYGLLLGLELRDRVVFADTHRIQYSNASADIFIL